MPPGSAPTAPLGRSLTPAQHHARARLVGLGATLAEWFTGDELRREYRRVALRCHPDRHAGASEAERSRLAEEFRAATDAYRCLRALADIRH